MENDVPEFNELSPNNQISSEFRGLLQSMSNHYPLLDEALNDELHLYITQGNQLLAMAGDLITVETLKNAIPILRQHHIDIITKYLKIYPPLED